MLDLGNHDRNKILASIFGCALGEERYSEQGSSLF